MYLKEILNVCLYAIVVIRRNNKNLFPLVIIQNAVVKFLPIGADGRLKAPTALSPKQNGSKDSVCVMSICKSGCRYRAITLTGKFRAHSRFDVFVS